MGYRAIQYVEINSNGNDMNIYSMSYDDWYWDVNCDQYDTCYIQCGARSACSGMTLICNGTCIVFCNDTNNLHCPGLLTT